ncbi:MAG TPA: hypothetical protein VD884_09095 [Ohtaekwangia sp.]|nr:hypothetical protein [Ohtaekwangia sp.]
MNRIFLCIALISSLLVGCTEHEPVPGEGHVQFSVNIKVTDDSEGRIQDLPPGASLRLTVTNANGLAVIWNQRVPILNFGAGYFSEPVKLQEGKFTVTDFLIVDEEGVVLYAVPKQGSPLTGLVNHPLPYPILIEEDQVSNVPMSVVNAKYKVPEEFGYASFNIGLINPLPLAVFVTDEGQPELTGAHVRIYNSKTTYTYDIADGIAYLPFKGKPDEVFTLEVEKLGYHTFARQFTYSSLMIETNNEPLKVVLKVQPGITVQFNPETSGVTTFGLGFTGTGEVKVDWRDGSKIETIAFSTETEEVLIERSHEYRAPTRQAIRITGDVQYISTFSGFKGVNAETTTELDLSTLPEIKHIRIENIHIDSLDLSKNMNIRTLYFLDSEVNAVDVSTARYWSSLELFNTLIHSIVYPPVHDLEYIMIDETSDLVFHELVLSLLENVTSSQNRGWLQYLGDRTPMSGMPYDWLWDLATSGYRLTYCCL